jgi:hypothetical protein
MNDTILAALFAILLLLVMVALPLIPAVVIYRLFPNTQVAASGPLSGLTLKSSGAFSAYIIVFLAMVPFVYRTYDSVGHVAAPSWRIAGRLSLTGPDGKPIPDQSILRSVKVALDPSNIDMAGGEFEVSVPAFDNSIPKLIFDFGSFGSRIVDVEDRKQFPQDRDGSQIHLRYPVAVPIVVAAGPYNLTAAPLPPSR